MPLDHSLLASAIVLGFSLFSCGGVIAQDEPVEKNSEDGAETRETEPTESVELPKVEELGGNRYRLGQIEFDAATRSLTFDAVVELDGTGTDEFLEYAIVNTRGSIHEALLSTEARAFDLQVVLRLLKYRAFRGTLFDAFARESSDGGADEAIAPAGAAAVGSAPPESDLDVTISWAGHEPLPISEVIYDKRKDGAMDAAPFRFVGAMPPGKHYKPQNETAIVGIYLDPYCMLNFTGKGNRDDSIWFPRKGSLPLAGSSVTVTIKPAEKSARTEAQ